jgi:Polyketide cyclase / dehydrase and lipid transport
VILRIVFIVALALLAVLGFAATKPKTIHLQRSIVIHAPAQKIFALIDDFHNWKAWAPGDKDDPAMQRTYSGPASGPGATSDWRGSGSTGAGRMAITESAPSSRVTVTVDFARPFVAHNVNVFTLEAPSTTGGAAGGPGSAESTNVTWSFDGTNVFLLKVMSVFMNMDRFMGTHFERGLANLKAAAEK